MHLPEAFRPAATEGLGYEGRGPERKKTSEYVKLYVR